jgi:hypothetical protein
LRCIHDACRAELIAINEQVPAELAVAARREVLGS